MPALYIKKIIGYLLTLPFLLFVLGVIIFAVHWMYHYNSLIYVGFIIGISITIMFLVGINMLNE